MNRSELVAAMRLTAAEKPIMVTIEGWGTLYVRQPTTAEIEEQLDEAAAATKADEIAMKNGGEKKVEKRKLARNAATLICDEQGVLLFDPNNDEDVELLAQQKWSRLRHVLDAVGAELEQATKGN